MSNYSAQDFKKGQPRWCPGCGDHFFLASLHKAMAEIGVAPENVAVISGIGCSSRLPHYMATYGMNTIHGRAAAIATGAKVANPNLTVWQVSGDRPEHDPPQQPHLRSDEGSVLSDLSPWLCVEVEPLWYGGGSFPSS